KRGVMRCGECAGVARCRPLHGDSRGSTERKRCGNMLAMCPLFALAGAAQKASAQLMRASCLALALAGCLPSSADLGQYSADWSPPPPELEQQMALPNQATGSDPSQQPSGSANSDGTSSTASGDSSSSAPAEPGSSSEQ